MSSHDYDFEPIPGLPQSLPAGEALLWQGSPDWHAVARHVFHVQKMALYFAVLLLAGVAHSMATDRTLLQALVDSRGPFMFACLALAVALTIAWFSARTTVYSVTSRRVVIRHGIALPMSVNIPFSAVDAAAVKSYRGGTGDISMKLVRGQRLGYFLTWPHVRRWHLLQPQPALRALADVSSVARVLGSALAAASGNATSPAKSGAPLPEHSGVSGSLPPAQPVAA